jgi:hypothetical protein
MQINNNREWDVEERKWKTETLIRRKEKPSELLTLGTLRLKNPNV